MPRASLAAILGGILILFFGPLSISASAASAAPATELAAANSAGTSSIVAVINYEQAAGRGMLVRLAAFARANPDVKIVVRPLAGGGPLSEFLAKAAHTAARQGKFAAFHEHALASPIANTWYSLRDSAPALGLDWPRFQKDFMDPSIAEEVRADAAFAKENQIATAPAIVAGGRVFSGPWEALNMVEISASARGAGAK